MVNDCRFIDYILKSNDLQKDTFNDERNSMFSVHDPANHLNARKRQVVADAVTEILWTLTGLTLAACGGTVTCGTALPQEGIAIFTSDEARNFISQSEAGATGACA